jgi:hypothetical protein
MTARKKVGALQLTVEKILRQLCRRMLLSAIFVDNTREVLARTILVSL